MSNENPRRGGMRAMFPTFVNEAWYPNFNKERDTLIERILQIKEEDTQGQQACEEKYQHGYTSFFSRDRLFDDPVFQKLIQFIYAVAHDYGSKQYWDLKNYEPVMTMLWCNINSQYSFHREHVHPYSQISGVFYLKCDESSPAINFKDPRVARWMVPPPVVGDRPENALHMKLPPEEGKTFMFPAWLEHGVEQNQTAVERISMSYNFEMRKRN